MSPAGGNGPGGRNMDARGRTPAVALRDLLALPALVAFVALPAALAACAPDDGPRTPAWNPDAPAGETDVGGADPAPEQADVPKPDEGGVPPDPGAPETDAAPADAHDVPGEAPCVPSCEDNECGGDGCGDLCGWCEWGKNCVANRCVQVCVPACDGKLCGEDGCGGECQPGCADNEFCGMDFTCV